MTAPSFSFVSCSMAGAVEKTGIGETLIRAAEANGDLVFHYVNTKPVIRAVDLDEWVASLPTERPKQ